MNRRTFLASSALTALAATAEASPAKADGVGKLRVGLIGCGWYGMVNLRNLLVVTRGNRDVEVVSVCDPDSKMLDATRDELTQVWKLQAPATHADFREMLKPRNLDVVIVGSPDHWHALHTIAALEAGADVYCEKPICHTIDEGKAMVATADRLRKIVQVGTQRRSTPHVKRAKEFVASGKLGTIGSIKTCCYYTMRETSNPPDAPVPATLNWDLWTGPAPMRPFNPLYHPRRWRAFNDYCNGIVGDMFVHMLDTARYLVGFGWPKSVSSAGGVFVQKSSKADIPDTQSIALTYPGFTVQWDHRTYGRPDDEKYPWATMIYGEKGVLKLDVDKWEFQPHNGGKTVSDKADLDHKHADKDQPANIVPGGQGHMKDFLECVASRKQPVANIHEGHISTATCLLGNVALAVGRELKFDEKTQTAVGDDGANRLFRREYRKPWVYPGA